MSMTRGKRVISFIEQYCKVPEGDLLRQPMRLAPFQKDFILKVYDNPHGTHKAILSIARKNGKTGLIAALLLAHLVGPEAVQNSQIISGAMSKEQAAIVFNLAVKIINFNPSLQEIVHIIPSGKRLIGLPMNVEYKALAAEGKTAHGLSPVLAILDEVGQVAGPQSDFIDAIVTAQGAHSSPLLITISTQSANDADLLSIWIDDAVNSKDPQIVCHLHAADEDADILDRTAWRAANPALGTFRSLPDMQKLATEASRMPSAENRFRNLNLNQRVSTTSPFISRSAWESCLCDDIHPSMIVGPAYGGLDLSQTNDLTAIVIMGRDEENNWLAFPYFWTPGKTIIERSKRDRAPYDLWAKQGFLQTTQGASLEYDFIARDMGRILQDFNINVIAFDRWRIGPFTRELDRAGLSLPLAEFGQGYQSMAPAIDVLEGLLLNNRLRCLNNPVMTMCAANAIVVKDPAGNRKLDKSKPTGRMDGMQALVMAAGAASQEISADPGDKDGYFANPIIVGI